MDDEIVDDNNGAPAAPRAKVTGLVDEVRTLLETAFTEHGQGEHITLEVWMEALPADPAPDAPLDQHGNPEQLWNPILLAFVSISGVEPLTKIYRTIPLQPFGWDEQVATTVARQVIANLLEGRAHQLDQMREQAQQAVQNGRGAPLGGLIVPGQQ